MNTEDHQEYQYIAILGLAVSKTLQKKPRIDLGALVSLAAYVGNLIGAEDSFPQGLGNSDTVETYAELVQAQRADLSTLLGLYRQEIEHAEGLSTAETRLAEFERKAELGNTNNALQLDLESVHFTRGVIEEYTKMVDHFNPNYIFVASKLLEVEPKRHSSKTQEELALGINAKLWFGRYIRDLLCGPRDRQVLQVAPPCAVPEVFAKSNRIALAAVQRVITDILPAYREMNQQSSPVAEFYSGKMARA